MSQLFENQDAGETIATTTSMGVGDYFYGTLDTNADSDWIEVTLVEGETYSFGVLGVSALSDILSDSYLRLRDAAGTEIQFDDDGGPGRTSAITFTAQTSGTYYLDVQSWNNSGSGDYAISMTTGDTVSYDNIMGNLAKIASISCERQTFAQNCLVQQTLS